METKTCGLCGETKPIEGFGWTSNRLGRHRRGQCKTCVNARNRKSERAARVNPITRDVAEDEYAWAVTILGWPHERTLEWLRKETRLPVQTLTEWDLRVPAGWSYDS
jgi:hypothetical protein